MTGPSWVYEVKSATPTITAGAYSANDVVGGAMTFDAVSRGNGGFIDWVRIVDLGDQDAAFTLHIYTETPTVIADNAAYALADADKTKRIGIIEIAASDYDAYHVAFKRLSGSDIISYSGAANLTVYAQCTGTPTYTATNDLVITLGMYQY